MSSLQTKALVVTPISGDNFRIIPPGCMVGYRLGHGSLRHCRNVRIHNF